MAHMNTLVRGSELLHTFTNLPFVNVLFAKGFTGATDAKLTATYYPLLNQVRFRLEETVVGLKDYPIGDSIFYATDIEPTATVYSESGAVLVLIIDTEHADYTTFITSAVVTELSETLRFDHDTASAATLFYNNVNRSTGVSIFDSSYVRDLNKRCIFDVTVKGIIPFLATGFIATRSWINLTKDALTGNLYLAIATSATGALDDFGTPIVVAQNIGTLGSPTYVMPTNAATHMPNIQHAFNSGAYVQAISYRSVYPYLIAKSKDELSSLIFTIDLHELIQSTLGKTEFVFDFGVHYLGMFKSKKDSLVGLGGPISDERIAGPIRVRPFTHITGVKVIATGGLESNSVKIKQRSSTDIGQVILYGTHAAFDTLNRLYLSITDNNPLNNPSLYGPEVDVTKSGTYVLKTLQGGIAIITTNCLYYNPYYSGVDSFVFDFVDSDIFSEVTSTKLYNGNTEYRCFYIKNEHPTKSFKKVSLWTDLNCNNVISSTANQQYVQFGYLASDTNRTGDGTTNPVLLGNTYSTNNPIKLAAASVPKEVVDLRRSTVTLGLQWYPQYSYEYYVSPYTVVPQLVDFRQFGGNVDNQLSLGSCTANAVTSACEMIMAANGVSEEYSRLFNYHLARTDQPDGSYTISDSGAVLGFALSAAKNVGLPLEETWPYIIGKVNDEPPNEAVLEAASRKIIDIQPIRLRYDDDAIRDIVSAVAEGYPVVIGFMLTEDFMTYSGDFATQLLYPYQGITPENEALPTGHAGVIVGYSNENKCFILENSWGASWGDNGHMLFPYHLVKDMIEAWVVKGFTHFGNQKFIPPQTDNPTTPPIGAVAPIGVSFNFADAESSAVTINNLGPNESVPIWIKRVINPSTTIVKENVLSYMRMKVVY